MFDDWHRLTVVYDLIDCCWFKATSNYILWCLLFECRFNFKLQCRRAAGGAKKMLENKQREAKKIRVILFYLHIYIVCLFVCLFAEQKKTKKKKKEKKKKKCVFKHSQVQTIYR